MQIEDSKRYFWMLINAVLVLAVLGGFFYGLPVLKKYKDSLVSARVFSVTSEGKTIVSPDVAKTSFSIVSRGANPESLSETNNQKMTAVIDNIKSNGIEAKDIKTTGYNLSPDYRYDPDTQRSFITGYTLTQTVNVTIRDIGKVAKVLAGVTPLGVNQIGGVSFEVEDQDEALAAARTNAIEKAKRKAEQMAEASGLRLGRLLSVSDSYYGGPVPYYAKEVRDYAYGTGASVPMPAPVEPGTQEVGVNVTLAYELK